MFAGVRPSIRFASSPTASTLFVPACTATTDGSRKTIPWSLTYTSVFAVPRSIPMSLDNQPKSPLNINLNLVAPVYWLRLYSNPCAGSAIRSAEAQQHETGRTAKNKTAFLLEFADVISSEQMTAFKRVE